MGSGRPLVLVSLSANRRASVGAGRGCSGTETGALPAQPLIQVIRAGGTDWHRGLTLSRWEKQGLGPEGNPPSSQSFEKGRKSSMFTAEEAEAVLGRDLWSERPSQ